MDSGDSGWCQGLYRSSFQISSLFTETRVRTEGVFRGHSSTHTIPSWILEKVRGQYRAWTGQVAAQEEGLWPWMADPEVGTVPRGHWVLWNNCPW